MSIELKIKAKHLALEPSIIKFEEEKLKKQIRYAIDNGKNNVNDLIWKLNSLVEHRKNGLREEARATCLARAFIKGQMYSVVESRRKQCKEYAFNSRILKRVLTMVQKYHNVNLTMNDLKAWIERK